MAEKDFPKTYKVLDEYGEKIVTDIEAILLKYNKRATGKLINSLDYDIVEDGDTFTLVIEWEDYGKYVAEGRRAGAKQPPIKAIEEWLKVKRFKYNAYAVSKSIKKKGIKPIKELQAYFLKPYKEVLTSQTLNKELEEAIATDIENNLKNKLK